MCRCDSCIVPSFPSRPRILRASRPVGSQLCENQPNMTLQPNPNNHNTVDPVLLLLDDYWHMCRLGDNGGCDEVECESNPTSTPPHLAPLDLDSLLSENGVKKEKEAVVEIEQARRDLAVLEKCCARYVTECDKLRKQVAGMEYLVKSNLQLERKVTQLSDALAVSNAKNCIENRMRQVECTALSKLCRVLSGVSTDEGKVDDENGVTQEEKEEDVRDDDGVCEMDELKGKLNCLVNEFFLKHNESIDVLVKQASQRLIDESRDVDTPLGEGEKTVNEPKLK